MYFWIDSFFRWIFLDLFFVFCFIKQMIEFRTWCILPKSITIWPNIVTLIFFLYWLFFFYIKEGRRIPFFGMTLVTNIMAQNSFLDWTASLIYSLRIILDFMNVSKINLYIWNVKNIMLFNLLIIFYFKFLLGCCLYNLIF
jgi:hypothetical protein